MLLPLLKNIAVPGMLIFLFMAQVWKTKSLVFSWEHAGSKDTDPCLGYGHGSAKQSLEEDQKQTPGLGGCLLPLGSFSTANCTPRQLLFSRCFCPAPSITLKL